MNEHTLAELSLPISPTPDSDLLAGSGSGSTNDAGEEDESRTQENNAESGESSSELPSLSTVVPPFNLQDSSTHHHGFTLVNETGMAIN